MARIKFKLSALRNESPFFKGDYVLNRNLCARYNELVIQLKIFLKMMKDERPYEDIMSSLDFVSWAHIRKAKEFNQRLKEIEEGQNDKP